MAIAAKKIQSELTVETVANDAYQQAVEEEAEDIFTRATELMVERVKADQEVRDFIITDALIKGACRTVLNKIFKQGMREASWHSNDNAPHSGRRKQAERLVELADRRLGDFVLGSGKKLRDAHIGEVMDCYLMYRRQSDDMGHKARWLDLVIRMARGRLQHNSQKIGELVTEKELETLKKQAEFA